MLRGPLRSLVIAVAALAFGTSAALAQVDVELAFSPNVASPGQEVILAVGVANPGSEPAETAFEVTIAAGSVSIGPLAHSAVLPAGLDRHTEIPFVVPNLPLVGTLSVTVTAASGGTIDTTTATLTIAGPAAGSPNWTSMATLGERLGGALGGGSQTLPVESTTVTRVKRLYQ